MLLENLERDLSRIRDFDNSLPFQISPRRKLARKREVQLPNPENFEVGYPPIHRIPLIKPLTGFKDDMQRRLQTFPYESNVFLMMKFREENRLLGDYIIKTLGEYELSGIRADDPNWNITDNVYNPIAVLYCCRYGIALFDEAEEGQAYSPNVAYELAMMHHQNKKCLILKHSSLPSVPFDLVKDLYKIYETERGIKSHITSWVKEISSMRD